MMVFVVPDDVYFFNADPKLIENNKDFDTLKNDDVKVIIAKHEFGVASQPKMYKTPEKDPRYVVPDEILQYHEEILIGCSGKIPPPPPVAVPETIQQPVAAPSYLKTPIADVENVKSVKKSATDKFSRETEATIKNTDLRPTAEEVEEENERKKRKLKPAFDTVSFKSSLIKEFDPLLFDQSQGSLTSTDILVMQRKVMSQVFSENFCNFLFK
jgi:hypothetical protein